MVETWQPVKSFPDYEVSNLGHFREKATGKAVKVYKGWYVHLMRHGILYARSAAKLVAQVYVPNPDPKNRKRVNQYNGKITDIRAENLYWANTWERQCPEAENRIKNAQQRIIDKKYAVVGTSRNPLRELSSGGQSRLQLPVYLTVLQGRRTYTFGLYMEESRQ